MNKQLIPKHITILGKKIRILVTNLDGNLGEFHLEELVIKLEESMTDKQAFSCLLHECCHAILRIGGAAYGMKSKKEEAIVRLLESGLEDIVKFKF